MYSICNFSSEGPYVTKWFIGLVFVKAENVNIDLTFDIQSFTDTGNVLIKINHIFRVSTNSFKGVLYSIMGPDCSCMKHSRTGTPGVRKQ